MRYADSSMMTGLILGGASLLKRRRRV